MPLKEQKLPVSEPEEGGRAKRPLTLDIAKAQKYSASIRTPGEEPRESHLFQFHSDQISGREKLGKYPQTPVRLDTDIDSLIAEETITPLPAEVERQLRKEAEELRQKQRADTLSIEEEESEGMEARLTQLVSQNSLQTAQEMADLKNQFINLQLQQTQQMNALASQTLQNATRLDGGGCCSFHFWSREEYPSIQHGE